MQARELNVRRLPGRNCSTPQCKGRATHGPKCDDCWRTLSEHNRTAHRLPPSQRGYDDVHRRLRVLAFQRDEWTCVDCGWQPDCIRECRAIGIEDPPTDVILAELRQRRIRNQRHLHGEHDQPIEDRPDLRTDLDNYRTRCSACHSAKTAREIAQRRAV